MGEPCGMDWRPSHYYTYMSLGPPSENGKFWSLMFELKYITTYIPP